VRDDLLAAVHAYPAAPRPCRRSTSRTTLWSGTCGCGRHYGQAPLIGCRTRPGRGPESSQQRYQAGLYGVSWLEPVVNSPVISEYEPIKESQSISQDGVMGANVIGSLPSQISNQAVQVSMSRSNSSYRAGTTKGISLVRTNANILACLGLGGPEVDDPQVQVGSLGGPQVEVGSTVDSPKWSSATLQPAEPLSAAIRLTKNAIIAILMLAGPMSAILAPKPS